ncbi:hypothetical protein [Kribbella sp. CA-294648]|uniref:hypothetical protein n=1 Tax=Kribbella sp. CA-294648 TaxID=3239948 RepID=UPI003D8A1B3C
MKQHGDGHWHGHSEITSAAVSRLYGHLSGPDGRIMGLSRPEYAKALDKAQAVLDRPYGAGLIRNFANTGLTVPYAGPGATVHSAWVNGEVQRAHSMADPRLDGPRNLELIQGYIEEQLRAAHASAGDEIKHLGAASHALQDSFSGAHTWREESVYQGDVEAPITTLHVFDPGHAIGVNHHRNTHADEFDKPLAGSGTVRAAVEANYRMLRAYHLNRDKSPEDFRQALRTTMAPMLAPSTAGVQVSVAPTREWAAERDRRVALESAPPKPQLPPAELAHLKAINAPTASLRGGGTTPRTAESAARSAPGTARNAPSRLER